MLSKLTVIFLLFCTWIGLIKYALLQYFLNIKGKIKIIFDPLPYILAVNKKIITNKTNLYNIYIYIYIHQSFLMSRI